MSDAKELYSTEFYKRQAELSYESAKLVMPFVLQAMKVESVVDFGCGVGTWLKACEELGISKLTGFEGHWVQDIEDRLFSNIFVMDLNSAKPTSVHYDLAISLEVAEHLKPESAENFVSALCKSAPVVLFSAAIPHQGGVDHINEQWQDYWAEIFKKNDFVPYDIIRPAILGDDRIPYWYRQNIILFVKAGHEKLIKTRPNLWTLNFVHPDAWSRKSKVKKIKNQKPKTIKKKIKQKLKRLFKA